MALADNITALAIRVAAEAKSLRTLINGNAANLTALATANKTSLVAAINELVSASAAKAAINDATTTTTSTWSSSKVNTSINGAVSALVAAAPGTLDTLNELAVALGNDPAFATTITAALGNRVRVDASQGLTTAQQSQARSNIGAGTSNVVIGTSAGQAADGAATATALAGKAATSHTHTAANISDSTATGRSLVTAASAAAAMTTLGAISSTAIGNPETDFVAAFEASLV